MPERHDTNTTQPDDDAPVSNGLLHKDLEHEEIRVDETWPFSVDELCARERDIIKFGPGT